MVFYALILTGGIDILPEQIRDEIEKLCQNENINQLVNNAMQISEGYRSDKPNRTISSPSEVLAYAAARMPATFGAISRAVELSLMQFTGEIHTVADYGAGTGAGIIAVSELSDASTLFAYELQPEMQKLGKHLCESADIPVTWESCDITHIVQGRKTDLALCCYCLNELPQNLRENALAAFAQNADRIIIVEPGTPQSFQQMKKIRLWLISHGFTIAAPCTHNSECPINEGDWCHFSQRIQRTALHKRLKGGEAPYEDEKFCFIAAQKCAKQASARIIRKPIIQPGFITLTLCTENRIVQQKITKSDKRFKLARKAENADVFPLENGE